MIKKRKLKDVTQNQGQSAVRGARPDNKAATPPAPKKSKATPPAKPLTGFAAFLARKNAAALAQTTINTPTAPPSSNTVVKSESPPECIPKPPPEPKKVAVPLDIKPEAPLQPTINLDEPTPIHVPVVKPQIMVQATITKQHPAVNMRQALLMLKEQARDKQNRNRRLVFRERDILRDKRNDNPYAQFLAALRMELQDAERPTCVFIRGAVGSGKRTAVETAARQINCPIACVIDGLCMASLSDFQQALVPALVEKASLKGLAEIGRRRNLSSLSGPPSSAQSSVVTQEEPLPKRRIVLVRHLDVSPMLRSIKPNDLARTISQALKTAGPHCALILTTCADNSYNIPNAKRVVLSFPRPSSLMVDACLQLRWSEQDNADAPLVTRRLTAFVCDGDLRRSVAQYRFCRRYPEESFSMDDNNMTMDPGSTRFVQTMSSLSRMLSPEKQAAYLVHMILMHDGIKMAERKTLLQYVCRARQLMHQPEHLARQVSVSRAADIACHLGITLPWIQLQGAESLRALLTHEREISQPSGFHTVHRYHLVTRRFLKQTRYHNTYARTQDAWLDPMEDSQFIFGYLSPILAHQLIGQCLQPPTYITLNASQQPKPDLAKILSMCGSKEAAHIIQTHSSADIRVGQPIKQRIASEAARICKDVDDR